MIAIFNEQIAAIPTLHVVEYERRDRRLPTVFFLHGFTSAKEHNLHVAYLLAEKGFRVFLPDALHHGEREKSLTREERQRHFWDIVLTSIEELGRLKHELERKNWCDESRLGVIGTSMGAITMYGALTAYDWIRAAVSLMGTAYYEQFAESHVNMFKERGEPVDDESVARLYSRLERYDLSKQIERVAKRPLLIWHGTDDPVVPFQHSETLYRRLLPSYPDDGTLKFIREKAGHKVSRAAILEAVAWFDHHLNVV